jgi:hypothetical protein
MNSWKVLTETEKTLTINRIANNAIRVPNLLFQNLELRNAALPRKGDNSMRCGGPGASAPSESDLARFVPLVQDRQ